MGEEEKRIPSPLCNVHYCLLTLLFAVFSPASSPVSLEVGSLYFDNMSSKSWLVKFNQLLSVVIRQSKIETTINDLFEKK